MIYFDNAATTFKKPKNVIESVNDCLLNYGANPGRSSYKLALKASRAVYAARETLAGFFNIDDPLRVIFTSGATESLNLAIKGTLKKGDHVITTSMEHNSVLRPLSKMKESGAELSICQCAEDGSINIDDIESQIKPNTKMVVCTHSSNLTGTIMPVKAIGEICGKHDILFLVDAAQSAGILDIDVKDMNIDMLAVPGHKGLMGMQGSGMLYIGERAAVTQLKEGGTGSHSEQIIQPALFPDRYESGTLNLPGIVSIHAGISFINDTGILEIRRHVENLTRIFLEGVRNIKGINVYGHKTLSTAVIPFNLDCVSSSELAYILDEEFEICTRAGLHCAPYAHKTIGTLESAAVRVSFGFFNTEDEVKTALDAINEISKR